MDNYLYYRIMLPTALIALLIFLLPGIPIRSILGFLIMFSGLGYYSYILHKNKIKKKRSS